MAIKIGIANTKGGIGKSTTALALTAGLQLKGYKVLMIDTDPQCSSSHVYLTDEDAPTLYDLLILKKSAKECIQRTAYGDIIACSVGLQDADIRIKQSPSMYKLLRNAIREIENEYDFIICDTQPHAGILLGNVLMCSEHIIVPVTCDGFGIQGLVELDELIQDTQSENPILSVLGILCIKYKSNLNLTRNIEESFIQSYAQQMKTTVFETKIRESVKCQEAQSMRKSIFDYAPNCTTAIDYNALIDEILSKVRES